MDRIVELLRDAFYNTGFFDGAVFNEEIVREDVEYGLVDDSFFFNVIGSSFVIAFLGRRCPGDCIVRIVHLKSKPRDTRRLIDSVFDWARYKGATHVVEVTTGGEDERMVKFFKKKGFEHCGYVFIKRV